MHAYQPYEDSPWGRRIVIGLAALVALAAAGYIGSVLGPHFSSGSSATTTTTHPTSTTTTTVVHSSVKVVVANGTQQPNVAAHYGQLLQLGGWSVGAPVNSTAPATSTVVYYAPGQQQAAGIIASELKVPATSVQPLSPSTPIPTTTGIDVAVVIGPDLAGNGFPATSTATT